MRIIFSGGGTGGHIFPAVAVAEEIKSRNPNSEILFIGALGKMEMLKVPKAGFNIKGLWISGFHRKELLRNLLFPVKLISSLIKVYTIIRKFKPDVIAGFGGYASGAALYMASLMGKPTLIQEQNSYPGITNKLLAKRAKSICVAYDTLEPYFPKDKLHLTGNPIRKSILNKGKREQGILHFQLDPNKKTVLISGGSLGARSLNRAMRDNHAAIENLDAVQFIWQCGSLYYNEYRTTQTAQLHQVYISAFIDDMVLAYAAADLVVSRAGALSISELCVQGKPSILVPSSNVAEDHQKKNAMALVERDAAVIIEDHTVSDDLVEKINELLTDEEYCKGLSSEISKLAKPQADKHIADQLIQLIEKN